MAIALVAALAAWRGVTVALVAVIVGTTLTALVGRRPRPFTVVLLVLVASAAAHRSASTWEGATARSLGPYEGWTTVVGDPQPRGSGIRWTVEIEGERFGVWSFGGSARKVARCAAGDRLWVRGERRPTDERRGLVRHVVGRFDAEVVGDRWETGFPYRPGNRLRAVIREQSERAMDLPDASLFRGLVIGDDGDQPSWMVEAFRGSGLSHLTAVSGQNVVYVLTAASPLLRRLPSGRRWLLTVMLIAWFALTTRLEPSVLRAGSMAVLGATGSAVGRRISTVRSLAVSVTVLVLVDPMLVWSIGFWLSVGATAGVAVGTPWWWRRLRGPDWWRGPLAVTLGAQCGVALPSMMVFGRMPVLALAANLLALPAAGLVMVAGIPCAVSAARLPEPLALIVMWPMEIATRWVNWVAQAVALLEPGGWGTAALWVVVVVVLLVGRRPPESDVTP